MIAKAQAPILCRGGPGRETGGVVQMQRELTKKSSPASSDSKKSRQAWGELVSRPGADGCGLEKLTPEQAWGRDPY